MAAKRCVYCSKILPSDLRRDARYCPGSRCRVYAYRERQRLGKALPPEKRAGFLRLFSAEPKLHARSQVVAYLQRQRTKAKLPRLVQDEYLQAVADEKACEMMFEKINEMETDVRRRSFDAKRRWLFDKEEQFVHNHKKIAIGSAVTHMGLALIPAELGGGIIVHTGRSR